VSSSKILTEAKHEVCRLELLLRSRWLQLETEYRADISKKLSVIDQSIDSGNTVLSSLNTLLKDYGISQSEPHNIQVKFHALEVIDSAMIHECVILYITD
jgi:hypothetical protein